MLRPTAGSAMVGWAGMRGIVTLATALALPGGIPASRPDPAVRVLRGAGHAGLQGLTLRPLLLALRLTNDGSVDPRGAPRAAPYGAYRAALDEIDGDPSEAAEILRLEYRAVLLRAESDPDGGLASRELPADPLRRRAIGAARRSILDLGQSEEISDDAFHLLEEELDWAELSAQG